MHSFLLDYVQLVKKARATHTHTKCANSSLIFSNAAEHKTVKCLLTKKKCPSKNRTIVRTIKKKKKKEVQRFYYILLTLFLCERMWNGEKKTMALLTIIYLSWPLYKHSNIFGMIFFLPFHCLKRSKMNKETNRKAIVSWIKAVETLSAQQQPFEKKIIN